MWRCSDVARSSLVAACAPTCHSFCVRSSGMWWAKYSWRVGLALILMGQVTGVTHAIADAVGVVGSEHCPPDCGDDDDGRPCLPFCATCACAHAARPYLRAVATLNIAPIPPSSDVPLYLASAFPSAEPASIFHPPKA